MIGLSLRPAVQPLEIPGPQRRGLRITKAGEQAACRAREVFAALVRYVLKVHFDAAAGRMGFEVGVARYASVLDLVVGTLQMVERGGVDPVLARWGVEGDARRHAGSAHIFD